MAQVRFMASVSEAEGAGEEGGGRVRCGKRVVRRAVRRGGRWVGVRRGVSRWWRNLEGGWLVLL